MTEPTTKAGRTLIEAFVTPLPKDAIELSARGLIQTAVPAIEAEAYARALDDVTRAVERLDLVAIADRAPGPIGAANYTRSAVLAAIEVLR